MADVRRLLESLALSQYSDVFERHDIDLAALIELGEDDLKELGVSLGHRVRLRKAIASLRAQGVPVSAPESKPAQQQEGERRQVTVMFCDLVGSSQLASRLDPEEMRDIVRAYQRACAAVVERFGGHLAQYLGDGVLAYFGYPQAHEDAAERAVHAGLGVVQAAAGVAPKERLRVRVGIATGLVVVGKVIGSDGASELSAIGDTPNLAARLQAIAEPDSVVIAEATHALTKGSFSYANVGPVTLKGFERPVQVWRVLGEAPATRFEAAQTMGMSAFVGREQEVALLLSRWEQAAAGEGQAVLLCGEAGIGKSRIGEQFRQALRDLPHTRVRFQCSPFHISSALQPVIGQLEFAAGMQAGDDDRIRLAKLEALLQPTTSRLPEVLPLFASLLGIALDARYEMPQLTSDAIKRRTLEALADQVIALSRNTPVYWQLEDAHWIDPTTRELVGLCLSRIRDARVFILITHRPDFASPWGNMPHVTALTLNRLARRSSVQLIEKVVGARSLPPQVLDQILAKTEGIPLFIEELTKTVLESGLLEQRDGRLVVKGAAPAMAIPATLQDSLMARLERLSPVKEVAQVGAAIGREFSYELLSAVAPMPVAELDAALSQLAAAELVYVRGAPPEATYVFKHALVQDAAYASLLRARRLQLHARIADALQEKSPDAVARHPELLAFHYAAAGLEDKATLYWTRAGRQAMERSDYAEAGSHFANALAVLRKSRDTGARRREEAELVLDHTIVVQAMKGHGSADSKRMAEEAVEISAPLGDDALHFRARWAEWIYNSISGNLPVAAKVADRLVEMANRLDQVDLRLQAHHARWTTANLRGEVSVAREDLEQGLALYDIERHRGHWAIYGAHDPGVCARATGSCILWQAGYPAKAARVAEEAVQLSDQLGHPFTRTVARWIGGFHWMMVGDAPRARALAESMLEFGTEAKLTQSINYARLIGGWATSRLDELGRGTAQMEATYYKLIEGKQRGFLTFPGTLIAAAKLEMGQVEQALNFLDELEQLALQTHQQMFVSELHRLRAEALTRLDPADRRVDEEHRRAVDLARTQGAWMLELRAGRSYAAWLASRGREREGYGVLQLVHERMPEGVESAEVRAAKALLEELR
jgi:class 3 adenylate cyclase